MKFNKENAARFGWEGVEGWALSSAADYTGVSAVYMVIDGGHGVSKSSLSDRVFYVLEGSGVSIVAGERTDLAVGDAILVPKNTPYDFAGAMKLFLVNSPAYDSKAETRQKANLPGQA